MAFALADIEPFKGILAENPNYVGMNLPWGDAYPEAMEKIPQEPQQFTQTPGGLLSGNLSDRDHYVFLDRIAFATNLLVDKVTILLNTRRHNFGRHRVRKFIWHLWRFFATTNTIQAGPARDQEPWYYIGGFSPESVYFTEKGINTLVMCLIESYSPDTYRLKLMGVPGTNPSTGDAYGCIDMIPPWPDAIFALKRARKLRRRYLAGRNLNNILDWANWCQANPGGCTVEGWKGH